MRKKYKWKQYALGYGMILPFYLIFVFVYFTPLLETVWNSFTDRKLYEDANFIGLYNYVRIFKDTVFLQATKNTLIYAFFNLFGVMIIGLALALLVNSKLVNTKPFRVTYYLPNVVSMVVTATVWVLMLDPSRGVFNYILNFLGFERIDFLGSVKWALPVMVLIGIWKGVGYNMMINLSGLQGVPQEYYEAATVDGANKWQMLWNITLPLIKPTTFFLFVTGMISSFNMFEQVNIMTGGGPMNSTTTVIHQIYTRAFTKYQMGYASAQSVLMILVVGVLIFISFRFNGQED